MNPTPNSHEDRARQIIRSEGLPGAYHRLIDENDALIRGSNLGNGREIAMARTAIHRAAMGEWAATQREAFGYARPFAVVALGGTGRGEMSPCSDTDFAFIFDDALEGNAFLAELQRQVIHTREFREHCGFGSETSVYNFDDVTELEGKELNAFVDMQPVYDPHGLADHFRNRVRETCDPFEHFLHITGFWREHSAQPTGQPERLDRFDIKNEGLRVFLAGIWTLAGKEFVHSQDVYAKLEDSRDLDAYHFLMRIRSFTHSRRGTCSPPTVKGDHPEDVLGFDDFMSFGEMLGNGAGDKARFEFGNEVRARLLSARRRVERFTRGVIGRELTEGRRISAQSALAFGTGGLRDTANPSRQTSRERSHAALAMLLAAQRYGLPIDPSELETTFRDAGDWLEPVPELSALFYETRGSLADSFEFLSQLDGAEDRLFPGYAKFETSLDERVMTERRSLRGVLERRKIRALEAFRREGMEHMSQKAGGRSRPSPARDVSIPIETALLDANLLAAVKLALKTKRLPETEEDRALRLDRTRPLHDRFSTGFSEIPLDTYYTRCFRECDFDSETLEVARFLVENRRAFKEGAQADLMDAQEVREFVKRTGEDEALLRALFVFTCADRAEWEAEEHDPTRWFNTRELYAKARAEFQPAIDPARTLTREGYAPDELAILKDFGADFFDGTYRQYAVRFGSHLLRLAENDPATTPRAKVIRSGMSVILAVAAKDHPGIAASISGALWKLGVGLRQAHLFSAMNHGLALDFFHLTPGGPAPGPDLVRDIENAIQQKRYIGAEDEAALPDIAGAVSLEEWRSGLHCLRAETTGTEEVGALIYALTCKAFRRLHANIFGLAAHTGRRRAYVSVYLSLPPDLTVEKARAIVRDAF